MRLLKLFLLTFLVTGRICVLSQSTPINKPFIDTSVFNKWPTVDRPMLSNNGKYVSWVIYNEPCQKQTLVVKSTINQWERRWVDASEAKFSDNGNYFIFSINDVLNISVLGSDSSEDIPGVQSFELFTQAKTEWLMYRKIKDGELAFRNLNYDTTYTLQGVDQYWISRNANTLAFTKKKSSETEVSLFFLNFPIGCAKLIWNGPQISNLIIDDSGAKLAFTSNSGRDGLPTTSCWLFDNKANRTSELVSDIDLSKMDTNLRVGQLVAFAKDGNRLFLQGRKVDERHKNMYGVSVDIWSYTDSKLQSQQLMSQKFNGLPALASLYGANENYMFVVGVDDSAKLLRLQFENEDIQLIPRKYGEEIAIVTKKGGGDNLEWNWNRLSQQEFYLVSTLSGKRKKLAINYPWCTIEGKYLIGTDLQVTDANKNLFSYEIATGAVKNMTGTIDVPVVYSDLPSTPCLKERGFRFAAYVKDDRAILVYDKFDLWMLDPKGITRPINLTNGYGRKNNIVFRLSGQINYYDRLIPLDTTLLISAFNVRTKQNGFYKISVLEKKNPQLLTMGPFVYENPYASSGTVHIKARDKDLYLVQRQCAEVSPNYFLTTDFQKFTSVSNVFPEKVFNWLTSELINFKSANGTLHQGVLYKPETFDPKKKYPVIIHIYEKKSDEAHFYRMPKYTSDHINIPWFVSRGYVVFTPDIAYTIGQTGQSAVQSVVGAAKFLKRLPWVDEKRMGIQGHSFGGYETSFIVTQTGIFAAAVAGSGFSNLVSEYGETMYSTGMPYGRIAAEVGQNRVGATLWEAPNLYIENSPIFYASKVTTPLLMMNNQNDGVVNFSQGVQFFSALRRLGKKAWMLQYDGETHSLGHEAAVDYTIRMTQFFDHYLKGFPAPRWMTKGVPAKMKLIDDGLQLDMEVKTPGEGLLINTEK